MADIGDTGSNLPPGASFISNICTPGEEPQILEAVDQEPWSDAHKNRRTQHYGFMYDYMTLEASQVATPIPAWAQIITLRLQSRGYVSSQPKQMIVNEYNPGTGIGKHTDSSVFGEPVVSVSLGGVVVMHLASNDGKQAIDLPLPGRSALILAGDARWNWTHEIAHRDYDIIDGKKIDRIRRVSLTFRWLKGENANVKK